MRKSILMLAAALLAASPALAGDRSETVKFKPGTASAVKKATIKGYDGVNYRLDAREGQVMQVLFTPSNRSCYFNVLPPASDSALFIGSSEGNEFTNRLEASGPYTVQVYLMRNAARRGETCKFTISFEITG